MFVSTRMTPNPVTVTPRTSAKKALDIMHMKRFANLLVVEDGQLVGIISKEDIIRQYFCGPKGCIFPEDTLVEEIMSRRFITVNVDDYLEKAIFLLKEKDISALPVLDNEGKLTGIITRTDVLEAFADTMGVDNEGTRIYLVLPDFIGQLAKVAGIVKEHGISIDAMTIFDSKAPGAKQIVMKVNATDARKLIDDLVREGIDVKSVSEY
jgi:acetoin utilization protein AcuB